jgi:hypothetical protein
MIGRRSAPPHPNGFGCFIALARVALVLCALAVSGLLLVSCGSYAPRTITAPPASSAFIRARQQAAPLFTRCLARHHADTVSGRQAFAACMHLTGKRAADFQVCLHNQVLDIGTEYRTPEGQRLFRSAGLDCAAQF